MCRASSSKPCAGAKKAESSADVKARVNAARDIQKQRFSGTNITCNAQMTPAMVGEFCTLDAAGEKLLKGAFERLGLTARSHDRLLRVARTIADLDGSEKIEAHHLAEAIQYRTYDFFRRRAVSPAAIHMFSCLAILN